jgi:hypothetical protein
LALVEGCADGSREVSDTKETNPKDAIATNKVPLHLCSGVASAHWAVAQAAGAIKYGSWNYRACGAKASVYIAAARRHILRWENGEEYDPIDGTHHLANVMACMSILLDCLEMENLVDDRPPTVPYLNDLLDELERRMAALRETHSDKDPKHYTILDTP